MKKAKNTTDQSHWSERKGAVASFAPGRIEFLGNHLDYNGGLVLGAAINAGIYASATPNKGNDIRLCSESFEDAIVETNLESFSRQEGKNSWANYCLGVLKVMQDLGLAPRTGFSLTLKTDLPVSVGLSSSAALELASALALAQLADQKLDRKELVRICRRAENEFVGVPCGILDQATSAFGREDHLVLIDCEKEDFSTLPLPSNSRLWVFDSGIKHDLVDSHYAQRHDECQLALGLIQKNTGSPSCLAKANEPLLEEADLPTLVKKRALHVVREQKRVRLFHEGLQNKTNPKTLGLLLTDSHNSSSEFFENSCPELDALVQFLVECEEVLGARLTGGGFGGAVLAWTTTEFKQTEADEIANSYKKQFGHCPQTHCFTPSRGASIENRKETKD
jgi:galactokinase